MKPCRHWVVLLVTLGLSSCSDDTSGPREAGMDIGGDLSSADLSDRDQSVAGAARAVHWDGAAWGVGGIKLHIGS